MTAADFGLGPIPLVSPGPALNDAHRERYARQLSMDGFDEDAQRRLMNARVLVLGAGGLGSPALLYLAGAGVGAGSGALGVIDSDEVEAVNLQRQVMHDQAGVGRMKAESAADRLRALNPDVNVIAHAVRLDASNVDELIAHYDVIVDGADNFASRYVLHDACQRAGKPVVWASVLVARAQVSVFWRTPSVGIGLRDLFPVEPPQSDAPPAREVGVLGPLVGTAGAILATETIKLLTGIGQPLLGRVLLIDALAGTFEELTIRPLPRETRGTLHAS